MPGLKIKSLVNFFSLWGLVTSLGAHAFIPQSGQIFRFQPNVLKSEKPFQVKGSLVVGGNSLPYHLKWYGPANYEVSVSGVGRAFSSQELAAPVSWVLIRQKEKCVIKTFVLTVACPSSASLWGNLELSAQSESIAKSLLAAGIYKAEDLVWNETDSRQEGAGGSAKNRAKLAIGENGNSPVAVLEIRGEDFKADDPALMRPLIQFDQTFLSPILLRYELDGSVLTLKATSDLEIRRNHTRFTAIIANRLEIFQGNNKKGTYIRKEPETLSGTAPRVPSTATNIEALKGELSPLGYDLFNVLLAAH